MGAYDIADGWIAWSGQLIGLAGGPGVGIVWLLGTLIILAAMALIHRFAA
jgi:amino acid transporter